MHDEQPMTSEGTRRVTFNVLGHPVLDGEVASRLDNHGRPHYYDEHGPITDQRIFATMDHEDPNWRNHPWFAGRRVPHTKGGRQIAGPHRATSPRTSPREKPGKLSGYDRFRR